MEQQDKQNDSASSLIDYFFHKDIVKDLKKIQEEKWRTGKSCEMHNYYYIGDYNIYDKIALLQEINTSLNLGLTIYLK